MLIVLFKIGEKLKSYHLFVMNYNEISVSLYLDSNF